MSKRRSTVNLRCPKCRINERLCFCQNLTPIKNQSPITCIVHTKEFFLPSNSVNLVMNTSQDSQLILHGKQDQEPLEIDIKDGHVPLYLYPDEDAVPLTEEYVQSLGKKIQLIVPDGTWRQAKKMKRRIPVLANIQSVKLNLSTSSIYELREQKYEYGLCTAEAIAHALTIIEKNTSGQVLLNNLKIMVDQIMYSRKFGA